jgi:hypothetical protein
MGFTKSFCSHRQWAMFAAGLSFIGSVTPQLAHAAIIPVQTPLDSLVIDGITSLREAVNIATANPGTDTIVLPPAAYVLTLCGLGALDYGGSDELIIEGNGSTIAQICPDEPIITGIWSGALSLHDLTIEGTPAGNAAAIDYPGTLFLSNCTVEHAPGVGVHGGTFPLTLVDSTVRENGSTGVLGGAPITVQSSLIADNGEDGLESIDSQLYYVYSSQIIGNGGAGVHGTGQGNSKLYIDASTIRENGGTGVCCTGCGEVQVTGSEISDNGLAASPMPYVCGIGGGLWLQMHLNNYQSGAPALTLDGSVIEGNSSLQSGAGARVDGLAAAPQDLVASSVSNTSFLDNSAIGSATYGGGLAVLVGSLVVSGSSFMGNHVGTASVAGQGGGLAYVGDGVTPNGLVLSDIELSGNAATLSGGGALVHLPVAAPVTLEGLLAGDNSAALDGGGLLLEAAATLRSSFFRSNQAQRGAGLFVRGVSDPSDVVVRTSTFADNAALSGAGIALENVGLLLENSTVSGNRANVGGGIAVGPDTAAGGASLSAHFVTLADNLASTGANVAVVNGSLASRASLIVNPQGSANCTGGPTSVTSQGYNFFSDATCNPVANDTVTNHPPALATLAFNGGPTPTRLPAATSPVRSLVPVAACDVPRDQRGVGRPQGAACEPGSVEVH